MKIVTNEKLIQRNRRIGQVATVASLLVLAGGLYLSFKPSAESVSISFAALLVGFLLSQVGIFFGNRWGRQPRPDQLLSASLKGLEEKYTLYNYTTPVSHLLLGPAGIWILLPYHQSGKITYDKGRWRQKGGNLYLKFFAQEGIGRPDLEVKSGVEDLKRYLEKSFPEVEFPPIQAALVFTNEKTDIEVENAPVPAISAKKVKEFIRKRSKELQTPAEKIQLLQQSFEKAS
ncbi:MAG: NERD domain-containing protein [Chloroflexi bacterium]|nr:NERD domain-containing protein [Chloroflexota bacterium]